MIPLRLPPGTPPMLFVIVDTEEAFDWSAPLSREAVDVSAIAELWRLQEICGRYGITPTYVIDFPVAATPSSAATLAELAHRGECRIGAHLHPWVNPPYDEPLRPAMSYACNLPAGLEREKIARLKETIVERLDVEPRVYKAGRYGFGPTTAAALDSLDFDVDVSINPRMDFSADGGPDFEHYDAFPFMFENGLLELPCTTGFTGAARGLGSTLHRAASSKWLEPLRAVGILARGGVVNKVMLSPEGSSLDEMCSLTDCLFDDGVRTFALTLHSPSLKPGCTPYVRTPEQLGRFLQTIDSYCEYFFGVRGGVASTPADLHAAVSRDAHI